MSIPFYGISAKFSNMTLDELKKEMNIKAKQYELEYFPPLKRHIWLQMIEVAKLILAAEYAAECCIKERLLTPQECIEIYNKRVTETF